MTTQQDSTSTPINSKPPNPIKKILPIESSVDQSGGKRFLKRVLLGLLVFIFITAAFHAYLDIYGLFRPVENRSLKVYHNERIAKYLLSKRYIPTNFNTVILGTSLSDNLDISSYNTPSSVFKIYNASMMGANISEIRPVAENVVKGGVKTIVFCVSPYQMKNSGVKEVAMDDKLYWGALGSKNLYETYFIGLIRAYELMPKKFPKDAINQYGVNNFTARYRVKDVPKKIKDVTKALKGIPMVIDTAALNDFRSLIQFFKKRDVNLILYFHPVPAELFESKRDEYLAFHKMIKEMVDDHVLVFDFNGKNFQQFTSDYTNYIDNGHLSEKGQRVVCDTIYSKLSLTKPPIVLK